MKPAGTRAPSASGGDSGPYPVTASARDHRHISSLILARDSDGAEEAMRKHVQFDQVTAMDLLAALG